IANRSLDRAEESESNFRKEIDLHRRLVMLNPGAAEHPGMLAGCLSQLADLFARNNRHSEAEDNFKLAQSELRKLANARPNDPKAQNSLAVSLLNMGVMYDDLKRYRDAEKAVAEARDIWQKLADTHPSVMQYRHDLGSSLNNLSIIYGATGRADKEEETQRRALVVRQRLVDEHPAVIDFAVELGGSQCNLGGRELIKGRLSDALEWLDRAASTLRNVLRREPGHADAKSFLAIAGFQRGEVFRAMNRPKEAYEALRDAALLNPNSPETHERLALVLRSLGRFEESLSAMKRAHELASKTPGRFPGSAKAVADCETLLRHDRALAAIQRGQAPPVELQDRIGVAELCMIYKRAPAAALKLWTSIFAEGLLKSDRELAVQTANAACAAARVAAGDGVDVPKLDDAEKARRRKQALEWLTAALATWAKAADEGAPSAGLAVADRMKEWRSDPDLASLRDEAALLKLPQAEQISLRRFWADVAALEKRAASRARKVQPAASP
ncbi:MAG TPA: tetratricopeptide repeat protein, partial [Planctomycetia bacterium]|nr:tetratricopeptide repeat protein [Planctomycetia bacterium]